MTLARAGSSRVTLCVSSIGPRVIEFRVLAQFVSATIPGLVCDAAFVRWAFYGPRHIRLINRKLLKAAFGQRWCKNTSRMLMGLKQCSWARRISGTLHKISVDRRVRTCTWSSSASPERQYKLRLLRRHRLQASRFSYRWIGS